MAIPTLTSEQIDQHCNALAAQVFCSLTTMGFPVQIIQNKAGHIQELVDELMVDVLMEVGGASNGEEHP